VACRQWEAFQQGGFFVYFVLAAIMSHGVPPIGLAHACSHSLTPSCLVGMVRHLATMISQGVRARSSSSTGARSGRIRLRRDPFFGRELYWLARRFTTPFIVLVVLPFVLFMVFWGAPNTGLLREGLHAWVLVTLAACGSLWLLMVDGRAGLLLCWRPAPSKSWHDSGCVLVEGGLVTAKFRWTDTASLSSCAERRRSSPGRCST